MPVECYDAVTKFAVNRFFWHRKKCKEIKSDIDNRDYGPTKLMSDWLDCWCTTVDDWCKAMRTAHGQTSTIVLGIQPSFDAEIERKLPVLVLPGTPVYFTDVLTSVVTVPQQHRPLIRDNFKVVCDDDGVLAVRLTVSQGPPIARGTYETCLYMQEQDGLTPLATVVVDVR
jgi:hypothetical protein